MRPGPTNPTPTDPGNEDAPRQARHQGLAYQGAVEAVMAIPIAIGIGYWLDRYFHTSPIVLILCAGLGFTAFVVRLLRLGRQMRNPDHPEPKS